MGDSLDCWRVEEFADNQRLRLKAEMKLLGWAWLQFEVEPNGRGTLIRQTAIFDPMELAGLAYWYALYPVHRLMFLHMLHRIVAVAQTTRESLGCHVGEINSCR